MRAYTKRLEVDDRGRSRKRFMSDAQPSSAVVHLVKRFATEMATRQLRKVNRNGSGDSKCLPRRDHPQDYSHRGHRCASVRKPKMQRWPLPEINSFMKHAAVAAAGRSTVHPTELKSEGPTCRSPIRRWRQNRKNHQQVDHFFPD